MKDDSVLSVEETQRLVEQGREALTGHERPFPRMDDKALRDFVMGYCDGHIYTDRDVPPEMRHNVFMPLLFGALDIPEDVLKELNNAVPPHPGAKPESPKPPSMAALPPLPEKPKEPKVIQIDLDHLAKLRSNIEWQVNTEEAVDEYEERIRQKNATQTAEYQQRVAEWVTAYEVVGKEQTRIRGEYAMQVAAHEAEMAVFPSKVMEWELAKTRHHAFMRGAMAQYTKDLGCIWEDMRSGSASSMSCNGLPCFFSFHVMHKDDATRAMEAIRKELEHRKNFTV